MAVALGGALGALTRYWLMNVIDATGEGHFPWGTVAVNVLGSLAIGILFVVLAEKTVLPSAWRGLLITGYLGAFTTFSTFSLDALLLLQQGEIFRATTYMLGSVMVCVAAAALGMALARLV